MIRKEIEEQADGTNERLSRELLAKQPSNRFPDGSQLSNLSLWEAVGRAHKPYKSFIKQEYTIFCACI